MKIHRLFILGAAAWAGSMCYKLVYVPTGVDSGISASADEQPATGRSLYSSINGSGSLGRTVRNATNARNSGSSTPPGYSYGNTYGRQQQSGGGLLGGNNRRSGSPAVEDLQPGDIELIQAAAKGDKNLVERRIAMHVKIDSRDAMRRTPLMYAAWSGYDDICNRLIAAGANPEFKDRDGNNAFDYAASRGLTDTLHFLLQRTHSSDDGHYMEYAAIVQATYGNNPALLPQGTGKLASVNRLNPEGQSPLHVAAGNGSVEMLDALVRRGADVNISNGNRQTPLHWAAWNNQPRAVKFLIEHGADATAADYAGNTPLLLAAQNGGAEAAQALLTAGADRYAANKEGKTASIIAEDKGFEALAQMLK